MRTNTIDNLAVYRLNSWKELEEYLHLPNANEFNTYLNLIYRDLMSLRPESEIRILDDVSPENREKFIKICCLFITEGNTDYTFSDDYTVIKRMDEKPEVSIARYKDLLRIKKEKKNELDKAERNNSKTA